ncbi:GTP 3',8-cyclase MoaA [Akkermansiaceae bacterium]|nr:GTP 3',8-cyclase MoaA [Akkermansiaceae bacterium]MDB4419002.1 GTP 3',8-cyclase MoaA [bacterium]MDB4508156.1 GTP 3',8-cyclase MoaA [Akkermansiaceae bacterium]MDB4541469.1 GTP 3',8-cyclase MoaA [Akkermansiaceae bacterium]
MHDFLGRPLRDLRISLTDRCNFRCRYCMPVEVFGPNYQFLPRAEILTFGEMVRIVKSSVALGVKKVRLTGGEPLLRRGVTDLAALISAVEGVDDLALTTNGILLSHHAEQLKLAGLTRVTVSLDALDPRIFAQMNGVGAKVDRVLAGIQTAQIFGLPVKVNMVVQRGVNETEILPMIRWAREQKITLRFIEYMDVGESNGWKMDEVVSSKETVKLIQKEFPVEPLEPSYRGEVAQRWRFTDGVGEFGVISSVTQPFCGDCSRLRISAEGKSYHCLFTGKGRDVREVLRSGADDEELSNFLAGGWKKRNDRYSEERGKVEIEKAEMSYLGG